MLPKLTLALRLVPLSLCVAILACPDPAAADTGPAPTPATGPRAPDVQGPTVVDADRLHGQQDRYLEAEGNVVISTPQERITADWLRYALPVDLLDAGDKVVLERSDGRIAGAHLQLKVTERLGKFDDIAYSFERDSHSGRGQADALHFAGRDRYRLDDASYTTCPAGNDDWVLRTSELELDYQNNLGMARNTRIEYLGTPILYAPWLDFALDDSRKTGFLPPSVGLTNERGFEASMPWYWNIAPNRDATLIPRLMTRRGLQLGGEFRYLEENYRGEIGLEVLPDDQVAGETRHRALLRHQHRFSQQLTGTLNLENVSDDTYFSDLSNLVSETSKVHLPREGSLNYDGGWWNALARVQTYQTLEDPKDPTLVEPLYQRVPQLLLTATRAGQFSRLPVQLDFAGEAVRFQHESADKSAGNRFYAYPSVSLPMETDFGFIRPKLGWHYTQYDLDHNDVDAATLSKTRSLPIASLDSGIQMERDFNWKGKRYIQTLEPRAYYLYIPYEDQSDLPTFDTGMADLSLAQLFAENQYVGQDRINDANQLTLAVTSRFLDPQSGLERLQFTLGQRYYFEDQRVVLNKGDTPRGRNVTDLLAQVSGQITDHWRLNSGLQYNPDDGELARANASAQYRPGPGKVLNLELRYINDLYAADEGVNQADVSWQWPLKARWYSVGRINYSFKDERLVEGLLGFEYNAGCWSLRGVAQQLATSSDQTSSAFFLQLELRGLARIGASPLDVLKRSISGYSKSDEFDLQ